MKGFIENAVGVTEGRRPTYVPWYKTIRLSTRAGTQKSESQSCGKEIYFVKIVTTVWATASYIKINGIDLQTTEKFRLENLVIDHRSKQTSKVQALRTAESTKGGS